MKLNFEKNDGFVTVVAVCALTKDPLMVAHMNEEAWEETLRTGQAVYYSKSRRCRWKKGETSGHVQWVKEIRVDCDLDAVVLLVIQEGDACHTGFRSCFFRVVTKDGLDLAPGNALIEYRKMSEKKRQMCLSYKIL